MYKLIFFFFEMGRGDGVFDERFVIERNFVKERVLYLNI